jgi:hypothetical protein
MSETTETTGVPAAAKPRTCAKCGKAKAGPGNVLCPPCKTAIETAPLYPLLTDDGPETA